MESESEAISEEFEEESVDDSENNDTSIEAAPMMDARALPIRAKPLFHNNQENVEEFPLSESKDGMECTSIVVGDGLFRVVKTTLHQDGVPRIDVQLVMDSELTSFQHVIQKPSTIDYSLSGGFAVAGIVLMMFQSLTPMLLGLSLFFVGLKFLPTNFEQHRLIFSSYGNSHEIKLGTFQSFLPGFRASMALVGPAMADYMKMGELDPTDINELHSQLRAPPTPQTFETTPQQLPMNIAPTEIIPIQDEVVAPANVPEAVLPPEPVIEAPMQEPVLPVGPPVTAPPPPEPLPTPLPPPLSPPVGPPVVSSPAPMAPLPPTPLPPPLAPIPAPPGGLNQPIPLNMPMPEAPRVAVQATPSEEPSISQEEQDALLNELA